MLQPPITFNHGSLARDDPETARFLEQGIPIPPGPRCSVCGHPMCPCCGTSCHQLLCSDFGGEPITDPDDPRELTCIQACCGGRCVVDTENVRAWVASIAELVSGANIQTHPIFQQIGPSLPARHQQRTG